MIKIVILLMFVAVSAFSNTTASLVLRGTVPQILEITVLPEPEASNLDLSIDVTDLLVATINERSNHRDGYTITLSSVNATGEGTQDGVFLSDDIENNDSLSYSITYDGEPVLFLGGSATIADVNTRTGALGTNRELRISYFGGSEFIYADEYEDTLTFSIVAK